MIEVYRGWTIHADDYIGYTATGPDYDAWTDDGDWVSNGQSAWGRTIEECREVVDEWMEENGDD